MQHLVETRVLVGNAAVDAIAAAEDRGKSLRGRGLSGWQEET